MRQRSNSLKISQRPTISGSSINSKKSFDHEEEEEDYSNNSDPFISSPSSLKQKSKRFQFKFRKTNKENLKSSLAKQKPQKKNILVLDLDETLVHTIEITPKSSDRSLKSKNPAFVKKAQWKVKLDSRIREKIPKDKSESLTKNKNLDYFKVDYNIINLKYEEQEFYVFERPNVREFLRNVCDLFEVYIYTAGEIPYAKPIIDDLCPMVDESHRRYGNSCSIKYDRLYKDLYSFDCPLTDIFIVDDNPENIFFWPKNTIICKPFSFDNENDNKNSDQNEEETDNDDDSESNSRSDSSSFIDLNDYVDNYDEFVSQNNNESEKNDDIASIIDHNYLMEKLLPVLIKCASAKDVRKVINSWSAKRLTKVSDNDKNNKGIYFIGSPKPIHT